MHYELKTRQICLFAIAFLPITKLFVLPSLLAKVAVEDMWISTLISVIITAISIFCILLACKRSNTDFYGLIESVFGKTVSKIILLLYAIMFLVKAVMPIIEQKSYIELTLFFSKFNILYFLPFFAVCFTLLIKQMRAIGRLSDIFWLITLIGFILLLILGLPNANFSSLLPVFARGGKSIFKGSFISSSWFSDSMYFLFFIGNFKHQKGSTLKIMIAYIVSGLMVVMFMASFYATFTTISFRQYFALTETTKYTNVISNIGRFDYLAIALLLTSGIISLALPLFFATHIICHVFDIKLRWIVALVITLAFITPLTIFNKYNASIAKFIINYSGYGFIVFAVIIPVITVFFSIKNNNDRRLKINAYDKT